MSRSHHPIDTGGIAKRLGYAICDRRITMGLSQQAVAEAMGISSQQVAKYERGENEPRMVRLMEIAQVLDTSVFMLLTSALGEKVIDRGDVSDRATLELIKRFSVLKPNERAGIVLLVRKLAEQ